MKPIVLRIGLDAGRAGPFTLKTGRTYRVVVEPVRAEMARVTGVLFELRKSFPLPTMIPGIQRLVEIYAAQRRPSLLVVGHTDTSGNPDSNLSLSLERARVLSAYLRDDVDSWMIRYEGTGAGAVWGDVEDDYMLQSLPYDRPLPYLHQNVSRRDAVLDFQHSAGILASGVCDSDTRRALIQAYMGADGTTLPRLSSLVCHGCGESYPLSPSAGGGARERDRRVEIIFFPNEISPAPQKTTSTAEDALYPQWLAHVSTTHHLVMVKGAQRLELTFVDSFLEPMPSTPYVFRLPGIPPIFGVSDSQARAEIPLPEICPERAVVGWGPPGHGEGYEYSRDVFVDCAPSDETERARQRLHNLGYSPDLGVDASVRAFLRRHGVKGKNESAGLVSDVVAMVDAVFSGIVEGDS